MIPSSHSRKVLVPFTLLLLALAAHAPVYAQYPPAMPAPPMPYMPPLLYVKINGPEGMKVTFYRGETKPETIAVPAVVGLRPGYVYRLKLSNIPNFPQPLFPTLEVRGSLSGGHNVKPRDFPAALNFTPEDIAAAIKGSFLSKVIVLERIATAAPVETTADNPLLVRTFAGQDMMQQAIEVGTPLAIMRMGQREVPEEEMQAKGLSGTILLPNDKAMPLPKFAPYLPWTCPALYDPKLGPCQGGKDMCLPDGGDGGLPIGFDVGGKLAGLDPADTVAEYYDSKGNKKIAVSNRVCICVPRFVVVRHEAQLEGQETIIALNNVKNAQSGLAVGQAIPVLAQHQSIQLGSLASKLSLSSVLTSLGTVAYAQVEGLELYANIYGPRGVTSTCKTPEEVEVPEAPLLLIKWPDRYGATLGDVITFTLKYTNRGARPMRKVVLSDSLVSRYEFIPGSSKTDRPATFTTQPNEAGSLILRWEINEDLPPGESGIIQFQVKIR